MEALFQSEDTSQHQEGPSLQPDLPSYIAALPSGLDPDVLRFLQHKGALVPPSLMMTDELIRAYVCYVHPFMPLLDMGPFFRAIDSEGVNTKVSILLFQAVMFAGVTFVNKECLKRAGFQSHNQARTAFFDRVKLLYNADIESDPITLIQVLLLIAFYHDEPGGMKGRRYFLSSALSFAANLGLDGSFELETLPLTYRKFRRRLWSCGLMIDASVSMSDRRAACIRPRDLTAPALQLGDLNNEDLSEVLDWYYMRDRETDARILRKLSIMNIKLYVLIDRILNILYTPTTIHSGNLAVDTKTVLVPKTSDTFAPDCVTLDRELREWYAELSNTEGSNVGRDHRRNGRVVGVHSAIVEMLYNTALILVHRPHDAVKHPDNSAARSLRDFSETVTKQAARRVTDIATPLQEGDLLRFLPPVGATALLNAAMEHVKDALPGDTAINSGGRSYLDQTKMLLVDLQDVYGSAGSAVRVIESVCTRSSFFTESRLQAGNHEGCHTHASPELLDTGHAAQLLSSGRLDIAACERIDWSVVR
ncbi:hypothetical protein H2204_012183 [Knufia peltigerae]|uniref:Xylanolytic transcriptional activator regulatory domain-containing protein n=1 Tax=Knufia peltigerae TaxID=1002370 RepID=A0AA38XST8_9EURO|nr:hypothetical protein H2204_012183 [Knufia peltigerae]